MRAMQRGFSIVTAIFLLVVLSFLGVAMVTFSTAQHQTLAQDVMGARAYQAARAGIEWAVFQVAQSPASAAAPTACATTLGVGSPSGALGGTLAPFAVAVACVPSSAVEGTSTVWVYDVTATATAGGAPGDANYVERQVGVKLAK